MQTMEEEKANRKWCISRKLSCLEDLTDKRERLPSIAYYCTETIHCIIHSLPVISCIGTSPSATVPCSQSLMATHSSRDLLSWKQSNAFYGQRVIKAKNIDCTVDALIRVNKHTHTQVHTNEYLSNESSYHNHTHYIHTHISILNQINQNVNKWHHALDCSPMFESMGVGGRGRFWHLTFTVWAQSNNSLKT